MTDDPKTLSDYDLSTIAEDDYKNQWGETIRLANAGDVCAANAIIAEFCACVENQTSGDGKRFLGSGSYEIDPRITMYLAKCLNLYLKGVDIDLAMGIKHDGKHRPKSNNTPKRAFSIAVDVCRHILKNKADKTTAYHAVAEKHCVSASKVEKDFLAHPEVSDLLLKGVVEPKGKSADN